MNRRKIEKRLNNAIKQITPDVYAYVANAPVQKMPMHDIITRQESAEGKSQTGWRVNLVPVFASLAVLFVAIFGWWQFLRVDSVVAVDVNPSVELRLNRGEQVVGVQALNNEAQAVLDEVRWRFVAIDDVVEQLWQSLLNHGYLQDENSFMLVSFEQSDDLRADALQERLSFAVLNLMDYNQDIVHLQKVEIEKIAELAEKYGVSRGVMQLALEAQLLNPQYSLEFLVELDLQTLYWLSQNAMKPIKPTDTDQSTPTPEPSPTPENTAIPTPTFMALPTAQAYEYLCFEHDDDDLEWDEDCWQNLWKVCGAGDRLDDSCVQRIIIACWDGEELDDDCFDD